MGLKCSLLGHSFGEPTVEREREERGSEVVTVVQEIEECDRCGERRVVSENKEVTSVVEPEEVGLDEDADGAGSFNDDEFEPPESIEDEDAEIIEDGPSGGREPGEWPEEPGEPSDRGGDATATADEPTDDSATGTGDGGESGASFDDEAEIVEGGPPSSAESASEGTQGDAASTADTVEAREVPDDETDLDTGADAEEGPVTLVCPECEWSVSTDSSFLEGDACPECQRGYLRAR